jgi:NADH:ubiquinone oxidoreductase subunit 6 (subunit J)
MNILTTIWLDYTFTYDDDWTSYAPSMLEGIQITLERVFWWGIIYRSISPLFGYLVFTILLTLLINETKNIIYKVLNLILLSILVVALWMIYAEMLFLFIVYIIAFIGAIIMLFLSVVLMLPASITVYHKQNSDGFFVTLLKPITTGLAIIEYTLSGIWEWITLTPEQYNNPERTRQRYQKKLEFSEPRRIWHKEKWLTDEQLIKKQKTGKMTFDEAELYKAYHKQSDIIIARKRKQLEETGLLKCDEYVDDIFWADEMGKLQAYRKKWPDKTYYWSYDDKQKIHMLTEREALTLVNKGKAVAPLTEDELLNHLAKDVFILPEEVIHLNVIQHISNSMVRIYKDTYMSHYWNHSFWKFSGGYFDWATYIWWEYAFPTGHINWKEWLQAHIWDVMFFPVKLPIDFLTWLYSLDSITIIIQILLCFIVLIASTMNETLVTSILNYWYHLSEGFDLFGDIIPTDSWVDFMLYKNLNPAFALQNNTLNVNSNSIFPQFIIYVPDDRIFIAIFLATLLITFIYFRVYKVKKTWPDLKAELVDLLYKKQVANLAVAEDEAIELRYIQKIYAQRTVLRKRARFLTGISCGFISEVTLDNFEERRADIDAKRREIDNYNYKHDLEYVPNQYTGYLLARFRFKNDLEFIRLNAIYIKDFIFLRKELELSIYNQYLAVGWGKFWKGQGAGEIIWNKNANYLYKYHNLNYWNNGTPEYNFDTEHGSAEVNIGLYKELNPYDEIYKTPGRFGQEFHAGKPRMAKATFGQALETHGQVIAPSKQQKRNTSLFKLWWDSKLKNKKLIFKANKFLSSAKKNFPEVPNLFSSLRSSLKLIKIPNPISFIWTKIRYHIVTYFQPNKGYVNPNLWWKKRYVLPFLTIIGPEGLAPEEPFIRGDCLLLITEPFPFDFYSFLWVLGLTIPFILIVSFTNIEIVGPFEGYRLYKAWKQAWKDSLDFYRKWPFHATWDILDRQVWHHSLNKWCVRIHWTRSTIKKTFWGTINAFLSFEVNYQALLSLSIFFTATPISFKTFHFQWAEITDQLVYKFEIKTMNELSLMKHFLYETNPFFIVIGVVVLLIALIAISILTSERTKSKIKK